MLAAFVAFGGTSLSTAAAADGPAIKAKASFSSSASPVMSRTSLAGQVRPRPIEHYGETISKADQQEDVQKRPHEPGNKTRKMPAANVRDRSPAADGCQRSFIDVIKFLSRFIFKVAKDAAAAKSPIWFAAGAKPGTGSPFFCLATPYPR